MTKLELHALGTLWVIFIYDSQLNEHVATQIKTTISSFENTYSRFLPTSDISLLNKNRALKNPSTEMLELLELGLQIERLENNFSIGVGNTLEKLGYDSDYSFQAKDLQEISSKLKLSISPDLIRLESNHSIDLGAYGKGYLIDKVANLLLQNGINYFMINAGGDIRITSNHGEPIKILLENPFDTSQAIGQISIKDASIACSASNRRRWKDTGSGKIIHHLINAKNAQPITTKAGVFTYSTKAVIADALSTAIFVSQKFLPQDLCNTFVTEALVVYADGTYKSTASYPGELYN